MTHSYEGLDAFMCDMRLQLVGSLKLQVSFAKEPYKRDDTLQKRLKKCPLKHNPPRARHDLFAHGMTWHVST